MLVLPSQTRISQPQSAVGIDWANPLTQGLLVAFNGTSPLVNPILNTPSSGHTGTGITSANRAAEQLKSFSGSGTGKYQYSTPSESDKITFVWAGNITATQPVLGRIVSAVGGAVGGRFDLYAQTASSGGPTLNAVRVTTSGQWYPSGGTNGGGFKATWGVFAVTYDGSSTSNVPAWYIDGKAYSGTVTTSSSPSGVLVAAGTSFSVGGRLDVTNRQIAGSLSFVAAWNRVLTQSEIYLISQNPWQIFQPGRRAIFLPATAVTLSYLRPSADISTGSWTPSTGTTLYETLDEVSASDADYIQTSTASSCEVKLAAGATPSNRDNHTIRYRILAGSGTLTAVLKCGSTTIKSWNHTITGSAQDFSQALSNAEATNITDYSDLRVTFTSS